MTGLSSLTYSGIGLSWLSNKNCRREGLNFSQRMERDELEFPPPLHPSTDFNLLPNYLHLCHAQIGREKGMRSSEMPLCRNELGRGNQHWEELTINSERAHQERSIVKSFSSLIPVITFRSSLFPTYVVCTVFFLLIWVRIQNAACPCVVENAGAQLSI